MSLDLNLGESFDIESTALATTPLAVVQFGADALQKVSDTGTLVKLTDVLSPLDRPFNVKISNTRIANVYQTLAKGTVPLGNQASNASGQSIFVEATASASKVMPVSGQVVIVPMTARIELRLPNDGDVTNGVIKTLLVATLSQLCGDDGNPRVTEMMRGVLVGE